MKTLYNKAFLRRRIRSAKIIVPIVQKLIHPKSVVDVGCGCGAILSQFGKNTEILGVEGPWFAKIDKKQYLISKEKILYADITAPFNLRRKFDLVICLEVAEHLNKIYADVFISNITKLGSVILFSAAIPGQVAPHHVNLQWPDYWAKKLSKKGFAPCDVIRKQIWNNKNIPHWYKQNTLLYIKKTELKKYKLKPEPNVMPLVHPELYNEYVKVVKTRTKALESNDYLYGVFHPGQS